MEVNAALLVPASRAAKTLGVTSPTIRSWIDNGHIAGCQMGRNYYVYRKALERHKAANAAAGRPRASVEFGPFVD